MSKQSTRVSVWLAILVLACGCAGHSARTRSARDALNAGKPAEALVAINRQLRVESEKQLPANLKGDQPLLLLDRAIVLQQLGNYKLSARDLEVADKQIEMMDFSRSTLDEIARFAFSDDAGPYKAPPYEKLMVNTVNMVNYLVQGDLGGARVEARRFAILQKYLKENASAGADLLGPGSYFAGFIFEKSNDPETAIRYYDEALGATNFPSLTPTIVDLTRRMPRPPENIKKLLDAQGAAASVSWVPELGGEILASGVPLDPSLLASKKRAVEQPPVTQPAAETAAAPSAVDAAAAASSPADEAESAELLLVISYGRVPAKEAVRLPIGLAITEAGNALSGNDLDNATRLRGAATWVNFPTLPKPRPISIAAVALVDTQSQPVDTVSVDDLVVGAWDRAKGGIIASAITRAVTREVTGTVAEKVGGNGWGAVIGLAARATMVAVDTPDTRSWATLPARIAITRVKVKPGKHTIELGAGPNRESYVVDLAPRGWKALAFTMLAQ